MKRVDVLKISYYPPNKGYAVMLQEVEGEQRQVPIIVGSNEAQAIAMAIEGIEMPRPMTHDLIIDVLENLDGEINRVIISRISNGTFYAEIEVSNPHSAEMIIDSRPSDAIAIALRTLTPIYISDEVMDSAGIENYLSKNQESHGSIII